MPNVNSLIPNFEPKFIDNLTQANISSQQMWQALKSKELSTFGKAFLRGSKETIVAIGYEFFITLTTTIAVPMKTLGALGKYSSFTVYPLMALVGRSKALKDWQANQPAIIAILWTAGKAAGVAVGTLSTGTVGLFFSAKLNYAFHCLLDEKCHFFDKKLLQAAEKLHDLHQLDLKSQPNLQSGVKSQPAVQTQPASTGANSNPVNRPSAPVSNPAPSNQTQPVVNLNTGELQSLRKQIEDLSNLNSNLKAHSSQLHGELNGKEVERGALARQIAAQSERIILLENNIGQWQLATQNAQEEQSQANNRFVVFSDKWMKEKEDLEKNIVRLTGLTQVGQPLNEKEREAYEKKIEDLSAKHREALESCFHVETINKDFKQDKEKAEKQVAKLQKKLDKLKEDLSNKEETLEKAQGMLISNLQKFEKVEKILTSSLQEIEENEKEIEGLKEQANQNGQLLQEKEKQNTILGQAKEEAENQVTEQREILANAEKQVAELQKIFANTEKELLCAEEILTQCKQSWIEEETALQEKVRLKDQKIEEDRLTIEGLSEQASQNEKLLQKNEKAKQKLEQIAKEKEEKEEEIGQLNQLIGELRQQIKESKNASQNQVQGVDDQEDLRAQLAKKEEEIEALDKQLTQQSLGAQNSLRLTVGSWQETQKALKAQLAEAGKEKEEIEEKLVTQEREISNISDLVVKKLNEFVEINDTKPTDTNNGQNAETIFNLSVARQYIEVVANQPENLELLKDAIEFLTATRSATFISGEGLSDGLGDIAEDDSFIYTTTPSSTPPPSPSKTVGYTKITTEEAEGLRKAYERLTQELMDNELMIESQKEEIKSIKKQLTDKEQEFQEKKKSIEKLSQQVLELQAQSEKDIKLKKLGKAKIDELIKQVKELEGKLQADTSSQDVSVSNKKRMSGLSKKIKALETQLHNLQAQKDAELEVIQKALEENKSAYNVLLKEKEQLEEELKKYKEIPHQLYTN